jgi:DeoR family fructose operon transcriptional repressor
MLKNTQKMRNKCARSGEGMKLSNRQNEIVGILRKQGYAKVEELAERTYISPSSVRRDLQYMEKLGIVERDYGGVKLKGQEQKNPPIRVHKGKDRLPKKAIAAEAAKLVKNGDVVTLDGGATAMLVAQHITGVNNVTFVVNSLYIANILADKLESGEITGTLIMLGGQIKLSTRATDCSYLMEQLDNFHFDICFASASAVSSAGVANTTMSGVYVKKMLDHSAMRVLVVDSDKLGGTSTYRYANATDFDYIITDDQKQVPQDLIELLENTDTKIIAVHI